MEGLMALRGVGEKTALAIMSLRQKCPEGIRLDDILRDTQIQIREDVLQQWATMGLIKPLLKMGPLREAGLQSGAEATMSLPNGGVSESEQLSHGRLRPPCKTPDHEQELSNVPKVRGGTSMEVLVGEGTTERLPHNTRTGEVKEAPYGKNEFYYQKIKPLMPANDHYERGPPHLTFQGQQDHVYSGRDIRQDRGKDNYPYHSTPMVAYQSRSSDHRLPSPERGGLGFPNHVRGSGMGRGRSQSPDLNEVLRIYEAQVKSQLERKKNQNHDEHHQSYDRDSGANDRQSRDDYRQNTDHDSGANDRQFRDDYRRNYDHDSGANDRQSRDDYRQNYDGDSMANDKRPHRERHHDNNYDRCSPSPRRQYLSDDVPSRGRPLDRRHSGNHSPEHDLYRGHYYRQGDRDPTGDGYPDRDYGRGAFRRDHGPPAPKLQTFHGDPKKWRAFFLHFRNTARQYRWNKNTKLEKLLGCVQDKAICYVDRQPLRVQEDYDDLLDCLVNRYDIKEQPSSYRRELQALKQREDETLDEFGDRAYELAVEGYPDCDEGMLQSITADNFLSGCRDKQAACIASEKENINIAAAVCHVRETQHNIKRMGLNRANIRQVSFSSPSRVLKPETKTSSQDQLCTLLERLLVKLDQNADTSRTRERRSPSPRRDGCYRCGKPGHFSRECPERSQSPRSRVCFECQSPDHLVRDCPKVPGNRSLTPDKVSLKE